jgi:LysM repeat protein
MNSPSPLVPQGSLLEQKNKSHARVRLAVFSVLAVHVVGLMALLITQGCKREQPQPPPETTTPVLAEPTNPPVVEPTNPPIVPTNPPIEHPVAPATTTEYTVVKGDNFSTIGKKFGVSAKAIQDANPNVNPLKLQPSQKIVIPAPPAAPTAIPPASAGPVVATTGEQSHVVVSGDTLAALARKYGTNVKAIQTANGLTSTRIRVGDKLKMPAKAPAPAPAETPVPVPRTPGPSPLPASAPVR